MSDFTQTPNLNLYKPTYNADAEQWGAHLNANADKLDAVISSIPGGSTGGFLPTAGGTMTGPLNYAATGSGGLQRAAQDRSADVANVLDFGADPTGVADSTATINAAAATGKAVYLPTGNYRITDMVTVNNQVMYGDGRGQSMLFIPATGFNAAAVGFVKLTGPNAVGLRDIGFQFNQPDTTSRASLIVFPPAIYLDVGARAQMVRVRIQGGSSYGIDGKRNCAPYLEQVEVCSLVKGLMLDGCKDVVHLNGYHFWPFNLSTTLNNSIMADGTTVAAEFGEVDGLDCHGFFAHRGNLNFTANASPFGYYTLTNVILDINAQLNIAGGALIQLDHVTNGTTSGVTTPCISVTGSTATVIKLGDWFCTTVSGPALVVNNSNADVSCTGGDIRWYGTTAPGIQCVAGKLEILGMKLGTSGAIANPFIAQSAGSTMMVANCWFSSASSGVGISYASDGAGNFAANNVMNSMTCTFPTTNPILGTYSNLDGPSAQQLLVGGSLGTAYDGQVQFTQGNTGNTRGYVGFAGDSATVALVNSMGTSPKVALNAGSASGSVALQVNASPIVAVNSAGATVTGTLNVSAASTLGNVFTSSTWVGGSSGPSVTTGAAAPGATQPVGSLYLRTGGAVGSTLYVSRGGGTWNAVAGV